MFLSFYFKLNHFQSSNFKVLKWCLRIVALTFCCYSAISLVEFIFFLSNYQTKVKTEQNDKDSKILTEKLLWNQIFIDILKLKINSLCYSLSSMLKQCLRLDDLLFFIDLGACTAYCSPTAEWNRVGELKNGTLVCQ